MLLKGFDGCIYYDYAEKKKGIQYSSLHQTSIGMNETGCCREVATVASRRG